MAFFSFSPPTIDGNLATFPIIICQHFSKTNFSLPPLSQSDLLSTYSPLVEIVISKIEGDIKYIIYTPCNGCYDTNCI